MYQTPEQLIAMNKANLEATMRFAGVAIEGAERMMDLQLKAAKAAFARDPSAIDDRFDRDYAAWFAIQPPAPGPGSEPTGGGG